MRGHENRSRTAGEIVAPKETTRRWGIMDELTILRTFAAVTTVIAAAMVAANWNARVTVSGFAIFIAASIAWMADGWLEGKSSLAIQNAVLLLINILGVWHWLPRAEKEAEA